MNRALIVVDVQKDFCEGGALEVYGGAQVAADITKYIEDNRGLYTVIASSRDEHAAPPDDNLGHFALDGEPDYDTSWPVHCVKGTEGAEFHPNFDGMKLSDLTVRKGYGCHSYSAFEGAYPMGVTILGYFRSKGITKVDVVGLAYDFCVKATALDAAALGYDTRIIKRLTAAVNDKKDLYHKQLFESRGITVV